MLPPSVPRDHSQIRSGPGAAQPEEGGAARSGRGVDARCNEPSRSRVTEGARGATGSFGTTRWHRPIPGAGRLWSRTGRRQDLRPALPAGRALPVTVLVATCHTSQRKPGLLCHASTRPGTESLQLPDIMHICARRSIGALTGAPFRNAGTRRAGANRLRSVSATTCAVTIAFRPGLDCLFPLVFLCVPSCSFVVIR